MSIVLYLSQHLLSYTLITSILTLMKDADLPKFLMNTSLNNFNLLVMKLQLLVQLKNINLTSTTLLRSLYGLNLQVIMMLTLMEHLKPKVLDFNLMAMTVSLSAKACISLMYNLGNITLLVLRLIMRVLYTYIHLPLNLKSINLLEHAICQELTLLFLT